MKKIKNLAYYKNEIMFIFIAVGGILGFIGSYMYYADKMEGYKLIFATLLSTIKLFFFVQTIPLEADYSYIYEIAKWIAPFGTIIGIFSAFGDLFYNIRLRLRGLCADRYVVIGGGVKASYLLESILSADRNKRSMGFLIDNSSDCDERQLTKNGIRYIGIDIIKDPRDYIEERLKEIRFKKVESIILFAEELENMINLKALIPLLPQRTQPYNVLIRYETDELKQFMMEESDKIDKLDIRFFNTQNALAMMILNNLLAPDEILSQNREPHIVIVGFDSLGKALLLEAFNIAVVKGSGKLAISIADDNTEELIEKMSHSYKYLSDMADIEFISGLNSEEFKDKIKRLHKEKAIDILCCTGEIKNSLLMLNSLKEVLSGTRVAVYSKERQGVELLLAEFKDYYKDMLIFGDGEEVLGEAITAEAELKRKAISFNASYNKLASNLMAYEVVDTDAHKLWNSLNLLKKESSLKQVIHSVSKKKILDYYKSKYSFEGSTEEFVDMLMKKLIGKSISVQADIIESDRLMNELAAIEHRRWCNFYLQKNFVYNKQKDEKLLMHDCLIIDWNLFLQSDKRDTIVYDFISWACYEE